MNRDEALHQIATLMGMNPAEGEIPTMYKSGNGDCWWISTKGDMMAFGYKHAVGFRKFVEIKGMRGLTDQALGMARNRAAREGEILPKIPRQTENEWLRALFALADHYHIDIAPTRTELLMEEPCQD